MAEPSVSESKLPSKGRRVQNALSRYRAVRIAPVLPQSLGPNDVHWLAKKAYTAATADTSFRVFRPHTRD